MAVGGIPTHLRTSLRRRLRLVLQPYVQKLYQRQAGHPLQASYLTMTTLIPFYHSRPVAKACAYAQV